MPRNVEISDADLATLEEGGGLSKRTLLERDRQFEEFDIFVKKMSQGKKDVEDLLGGGDKEGQEELVKLVSTYFLTMRVVVNGEEMWPKKGYAEKVRSNLKMSILSKYNVDITNKGLFPSACKNWKAFCEQLVKAGRSETEHHPEVDPVTLEAIHNLGMAVKEALDARGTEEYEEKLQKIPVNLRDKMNAILQWIAMLELILFECRRGGENIHELKKVDFVIFKDLLKKFDYIKHVKTEKDKNHAEGTNSSIYGCIPFMDFADNFNPGEIFSFYMNFLPDDSTKPGIEGGFLFPRPKMKSSKFNPHNPDEMCLYEANQRGLLFLYGILLIDMLISVGRNQVYGMLPNLTDAVGRPRQTNHSVR